MSDEFWKSLPLILAAIGTIVVPLYTAYQAKQARTDINKVEKATNSMKDALVLATKTAATLEGIQQGKDAEMARQQQQTVTKAEGAAEEKARTGTP